MSESLTQYFEQEAGEYLDQLDALLAGAEPADPVRLFRLARGVRGSAQLAGAAAVAEVAEGLENGARALRDGVLHWSDELRDRVRATAADLRALVEGAPGEGLEGRAREAAGRWSGVGTGRRRGDDPVPGDELFAFVRREIAAVSAEMNRVLGELSTDPAVREPLRMVLRRMRPVRGVAGMQTLAPVLEVLEGVEDLAHEVLTRAGAVAAAELELLAAARDALRAAGSALEEGRVPRDSAELAAFRDLRDRAGERGDADAEVAPVSRFFADGDAAPLVSSPMAPFPGDEQTADRVEPFVAMEATGFLDRAEGVLADGAARPRRLGRAAREAADLVAGVRELASLYGLGALGAAAELAAGEVRAAAGGDEAREALRRLRRSLPGAPAAAAPEPSAAAAPAEAAAEAVPVETLLYAPDDALREALALRGRIATMASDAPLKDALDELFGLVELGLSGRG
jgi:chemotaxis protein histidine kinase CheA